MTQVPALPGHALFLLLLQVTLILVVSRLLAEAMKRLGQPAVIGELSAGILLGPSLLGWIWPGAFQRIFPADPMQVHLLEVLAWIGMIFLLLLTGLETDVRLLRRLGRTALTSSAMGMVVPFAFGYLLGVAMPAEYMGEPHRRFLFAAFLATAMSISAMPVIAKILLDLELTKRNIGVVILSAGVVDDTTGWLILSLIAGLAKAQDWVLLQFLKTLCFTVLFLAACWLLFFPTVRWLIRVADDRARTANADLTVIVGFAFLLSALTEKIGIHAVFGAFVAGCILRQVPRVRPATLHRLESVSVSIFAPVFFGLVGLKVDLRSLGSPRMMLIVLAVATAGKLLGCTWGGLLGKMSFAESFAIGVAMNARGAMELVVALLGLTLGIISPAMFAIIVMMAIVTSFMAPFGLRLALRYIRITPEEQARLALAGQRGLFNEERLKVLLPTAGGPNALYAGRIASALVRGDAAGFSLLYVESGESLWRRLARRLRPDPVGKNLQSHVDLIKTFADLKQARVEMRRTTDPDVVGYICKEAAHGFDLLLVGAGLTKHGLHSSVNSAILERAPCHVAIVRGRGPIEDARRVLVATNGSLFSQAALELSILYAERVGAQVTVLYSMEGNGGLDGADRGAGTLDEGFRRMLATTVLASMSPLLGKTKARVSVLVRESDQPTPPLLDELRSGLYQMLVVGAENRALQHRLIVGYDVDRLVEDSTCSVMVVVPRIGGVIGEHA